MVERLRTQAESERTGSVLLRRFMAKFTGYDASILRDVLGAMFESAGEHDLKATQIWTMSMSKSSGCDPALEIANLGYFTPKSVE